MLNLNSSTLQAVADKAIIDAAAHPRWINAIGRALVELETNPWIERGELHGLVIASPSGRLYSANGTCQCEAYTHSQACWHRAAARLVRLHDEHLASALVVCEQPDNTCEVHAPCAAHAEQASAYLLGERIARARTAQQLLNECF